MITLVMVFVMFVVLAVTWVLLGAVVARWLWSRYDDQYLYHEHDWCGGACPVGRALVIKSVVWWPTPVYRWAVDPKRDGRKHRTFTQWVQRAPKPERAS